MNGCDKKQLTSSQVISSHKNEKTEVYLGPYPASMRELF